MKSSYEKKSFRDAVSNCRRQYLSQSEFCEKCKTETDIRELNLVTGLCPICSKWDKKKMKELFERGLECLDSF